MVDLAEERMKFDFRHQRKRGTNLPPRWAAGEMIGEMTVITPLEYGDRGLQKRQWWYRVQCSCGTIEDKNQSSMLKGRTDCKECAAIRKSRSLQKHKPQVNIPKNLPNFATMKLRCTE